VLPPAVLSRPKSPLSGDPQWEAARRLVPPKLIPEAGLETYVDCARVPIHADQDMMTFWTNLRPRTLNYWLKNLPHHVTDFENLQRQNERHSIHERARKSQILRAAS